MDQNSNYITVEMTFRLQMVCGARHNICYVRRWIMWTVLLVKVIASLYGHFTPHNQAAPSPAIPAGYSPVAPNSRRG